MSFEKNQYKQEINKKNIINCQKEDNITNKNPENNLLLKPIAIKQNILTNNQSNTNINKYPSVSVIYPNQPTPYLNDINQINYIKSKDSEKIKYNSNENEKGAFSLYQNYNNNNSNNTNNNNINNNKINYGKNESGEQNSKIHCTCKKTKCIKKYCECFSSGVLCFNCKCENCENKSYFIDGTNNTNNNINNIKNTNIDSKKEEEDINDIKNNKQNNENNNEINDNNLKKLIICTCSKSGCNKNYCECFKAKVKCNNKCRCIKCLNKPEDSSIPLDEEKIIIRKSVSAPINTNNINSSIYTNSFTVQRISININKVQTLINTEKLDYFDTNKFLSKKRIEN